jgi:hypothetical protein
MVDAGEDCAIIVDGETLLDLIYEPSEKCLKEIERLDFFRRRDLPVSEYYYNFDIELDGDRPSKFQKQQIYEVLNNILRYITATREYFYWYISTHTNLGNVHAVKKALARCG